MITIKGPGDLITDVQLSSTRRLVLLVIDGESFAFTPSIARAIADALHKVAGDATTATNKEHGQ